MGYKIARFLILVFAVWFAWVSWRAVPHFSEGLDEGLNYYRYEAVQILDEFAAAGERLVRYVRTRTESLQFSDDIKDERPAPRFKSLAA